MVAAVLGKNYLNKQKVSNIRLRSYQTPDNFSQSAIVSYFGGYQRIILAVVAIFFVVMFVYPPFQVIGNNGSVFNMGYGWIFEPPKRGNIGASVNVPMLLVQWVGVLVVGGLAFALSSITHHKSLAFLSLPMETEELHIFH
jgi:hypothetical protein